MSTNIATFCGLLAWWANTWLYEKVHGRCETSEWCWFVYANLAQLAVIGPWWEWVRSAWA